MKKTIRAIVIALTIAATHMFFFGMTPAYASQDRTAALNLIETNCNPQPTIFDWFPAKPTATIAAYPTDISFDAVDGTLEYTMNTVWRHCAGNSYSRAFAITGYGTSNTGMQVCPLAGWYKNSNAAEKTYDCVKFITSGGKLFGGITALDCKRNGVKKKNLDCVNNEGAENYQKNIFTDRIGIRCDAPTTNVDDKCNHTSYAMKPNGLGGNKVPNWDTVKHTQSSYTFRSGDICGYYKDSGNRNHNTNCDSFSITVSWDGWKLGAQTRINPDMHNSSIGDPVGFEHQITNEVKPTTRPLGYTTRIVRVPKAAISTETPTANAEKQAIYAATPALNHYGTTTDRIAIPSNQNVGTVLDYAHFSSGPDARTDAHEYTLTSDDANSWICSYIQVAPAAQFSGDDEWVRSNPSCVFVNNDYDLTPRVQVPDVKVYEPGSQVSPITPAVRNNSHTAPSDTEWRFTRLILPPTSTDIDVNAPLTDNSSEPCVFWAAHDEGSSCDSLRVGHTTFAKSSNWQDLPEYTETLGEHPVGTRYCYGLSLLPPSSNPELQYTWRHSALECVKIGRQPKMQVRGGDIIVQNGGIDTSTSRRNFLLSKQPDGSYSEHRTYGSWGDYSAIALNRIIGFASSGLYRTGATSETRDLGHLTFSNDRSTTGTSTYGNYGAIATDADSLAQRLASDDTHSTALAGNRDIDLSTTPSGTYLLASGGTVRLSAQTPDHTIPADRSIVLLAPATTKVLFNSNIVLPENYTNAASISQVAIAPAAAGDSYSIGIAPTVNRIDSWLITPQGSIDTCSLDVASTDAKNIPRAYAECDNTLTINGPVAAAQLFLRRVGGTLQAETNPQIQSQGAEIFNLRPDAYIWAHYRHDRAHTYITTNSLDLPPRY